MARPKPLRADTPRENVSVEDKFKVLQTHIGPMIQELRMLAVNNDLTGDDVREVFVMALAAVIDHDDYLKTPQHLREAAASAGKLIGERVKDFRRLSEEVGTPVLDLLLTGATLGAIPKPH